MNNQTLLLRQVHPNFIDKGIITRQVFQPTRTNPQLSVYDGDQINAEDSWIHFTQKLHRLSRGVVAVSVEECSSIEALEVKPDPGEFPEHALISFVEKFSRSELKRISTFLQSKAHQRGWLYKPQ